MQGSHLHGNQRALYLDGSLNELYIHTHACVWTGRPAFSSSATETGGPGDRNPWINQFFHWRRHNRCFWVGEMRAVDAVTTVCLPRPTLRATSQHIFYLFVTKTRGVKSCNYESDKYGRCDVSEALSRKVPGFAGVE